MKSLNEKLVLKRKLTAASIVAVTFVFLLIINIGSYFFLQRIGSHLEKGLDDRLKMAASFAIQLIEKETTNFYDPLYQSLLRINLGRIHTENELESAYLIDSNLHVIVDSRYDFLVPSRGYIQEDSIAIRQSFDGVITTSNLHTFEGNNFKNVYASLFDYEGNVALLVLEANADFLQVMNDFKKGLFFGFLFSAMFLVIITIYLIFATKSILKFESELYQSRRLASMGQMSATMAHEIRNPLGIIKSTADVLRERYENPSAPDELFSFINEETNRLNKLVNDFLSLSREPKLTLAEHEINEIINSAILKIQPEITNLIKINYQHDTPISLTCDRDLIHQVMLNVLLNAIQAIGEKDGQIDIGLFPDNIRLVKFAHIKFIDNGPGFKNKPSTAFEPFYTTKTTGTGLGLAVSKTIIEKHGGQISASNLKSGGAQIDIYLPI